VFSFGIRWGKVQEDYVEWFEFEDTWSVVFPEQVSCFEEAVKM
jgi:hypothetical protein